MIYCFRCGKELTADTPGLVRWLAKREGDEKWRPMYLHKICSEWFAPNFRQLDACCGIN